MPTAGAKLYASELPFVSRAVASSLLALTSTITDVPGATVTNVLSRNLNFIAWGVFDTETLAAATTTAIGYLYIDGAAEAEQALLKDTVSGERATIAQVWTGSLGAGSHTLTLRGSAVVSSQFRFNATHTTLTILWFG